MKAAALLIVLLSNDGYWFGDRDALMTFQLDKNSAAAHVTWELSYGAAVLTEGKFDLQPGQSVDVKLKPPAVRDRNHVKLSYRAVAAGDKPIESGEKSVYLFAPLSFSTAIKALGDRRVVVLEPVDGTISPFLKNVNVPHSATASTTSVRLERPDVLIVGPDVLGNSSLEQFPIADMARLGASILVLKQTRAQPMAGYKLQTRTAPREFTWQKDHALLTAFTEEDLKRWIPEASEQVVLRIPADEPVLELAGFAVEVKSDKAAPMDALLVTTTIGRGRIVTCQLPLSNQWENDARGQLFLRSALEYLSTPPGPTPRWSERQKEKTLIVAPQPNILNTK